MVNLELYAWVVAGNKQRVNIIKALSKPMTPSETRKKSTTYNPRISLNNASDALRSFVKQGLAICLNPKAKRGRLYKLTEEGKEIREELMRE
jgi:predicted transcriptional regulator